MIECEKLSLDIYLHENDFNIINKWDIIKFPEKYTAPNKSLMYIVIRVRKNGNYKLLPYKKFSYKWMYYFYEFLLWQRDFVRLQRTRISNVYYNIIEYYRNISNKNAKYMADQMKKYINK